MTLKIAGLDTLPVALVDAAKDTVERVLALQEDARKPWDYIRVEVWEDSGRVIIFPALSSSQNRVDVAGVQIACAELEARIDALSKSGLTDEIYTDEVEKEVAEVVSTARKVLSCHLSHLVRVFDSFDRER